MQYHYIVMFDDETKEWDIIGEPDAYLPDGNVYDPSDEEYGWFMPSEYDEDDRAYVIDERCYTMLTTLASIWPAVDTEV